MKKALLLLTLFAGMVGNAMADDNDNVAVATYGNATGNTTRTMTVALNHGTDSSYVAFQMDLTLPEGTTIDATKIVAKAPMKAGGEVEIGGTKYSTDFVLAGNTLSDGTYRVLGYNLGNTAIGGTSGDICLTIPLTTTEGIAYDASTVKVSNVIFVESANLAKAPLANAETSSNLWGDVVVDKKIDGKDIQATANLYTGKSNTGTIDKFAGDIDENGIYNGIDIQGVANIYTKGSAK